MAPSQIAGSDAARWNFATIPARPAAWTHDVSGSRSPDLIADASPPRATSDPGEWLALLGGHGVRPKLSVSEPNDPDEREADAISDQVMRMTAPAAAPLQIGRPAPVDLSRACAQCEGNEEDDARIARKARAPAVARHAAQSAADAVASGGRPLPPAERAFFEPRFGHDLGHVRIHTGPAADRAATGIGALAFSYKQHIAFADGQYQPGAEAGRRLLAHELTHTLQQSAGAPLATRLGAGAGAARVTRRAGDATILRACPPPVRNRGGAAGCGICMGGNFGVIGALIHQLVQYQFFFNDPSLVPHGEGMEMTVPTVPEGETPPFVPEVDLARIVEESGLRVVEIGEIKPFDDAGAQRQVARNKLDDYARELREGGHFDLVRMIRTSPPDPFPFVEPTRPPGCPPQMINTCLIEPGIYQYFCEPSWADAQRNPACRCGARDEERERNRVRVPAPKDVPVTPPLQVPQDGPTGRQDRPPNQTPVAPPVPAPPITAPPVTVPAPPSTDAPPVTTPKPPVTNPDAPVTDPAPPDNVIPFPGRPRPAKPVIDEDDVAVAARVAVAAAVLWGLKKLAGTAARRFIAPLEAAAVAVLVVFYSNRAHAEPGPGQSPLESLFDAMQKDGVPVDDEMRKRIEADPALKQALENAASTGDLSEAQREISQRTMEIIAQNPDSFSEEDLRILAQQMDAASQGDPATKPTVESLRQAIEAKKRGESIKPIIDKAVRDGKANAPGGAKPGDSQAGKAQSPAATPKPDPAKPKPEPLPIPETYRSALAATPERERLFRAMVGPDVGLRLTDKMTERFLATVPKDLTAAQADALIDRVTSAQGATEDEIFARLERAIKEVRADGKPADDDADSGDKGSAAQPNASGSGAPIADTPQAPEKPATPATQGPGQAPPGAAAKPAAGLTPEQLARLKTFLAAKPAEGVINPLPEPKNRVVGYAFTRLIAIGRGDTQVAGYMKMRISKVRSLNDFDVTLYPTFFYNAAGQRHTGFWPAAPIVTPVIIPPK